MTQRELVKALSRILDDLVTDKIPQGATYHSSELTAAQARFVAKKLSELAEQLKTPTAV